MPSIFTLMRDSISEDPRARRHSMPARPRQYRSEGDKRIARYVEDLNSVKPEERWRQESPAGSRRDSASPGPSSPTRRGYVQSEDDELDPSDSVSVAHKKRRSANRRPYSWDADLTPGLSSTSSAKAKLTPVKEEYVRAEPSNVPAERASGSGKTIKSANSVRSSIFGSLLRRNTTTSVPASPRLVNCLTCGADDIPSTQSAKLSCRHRMCHDCLKRIFELSVKDPAHMPPRCCSKDHIPLKHVDKLFDLKFKKIWNRKYQEFNAKQRIYCPAQGCAYWIRSEYFRAAQGVKFAQCPKCNTKVCMLCHGKLHKSGECPKDPALQKLAETARREGWQSCYRCNAMIERNEGCNHMKCRCLAEFCMVCGQKWKTCTCPLFTTEQVRQHNETMVMDQHVMVDEGAGYHVYRYRAPPRPRAASRSASRRGESRHERSISGDSASLALGSDRSRPGHQRNNSAVSGRRRERHEGTSEIRRERDAIEHHRRTSSQQRSLNTTPGSGSEGRRRSGATLTRNMGHQLRNTSDDGHRLPPPRTRSPDQRRQRGASETWGVGNGAEHFLNDNFVQNLDQMTLGDLGDPGFARRGTREAGRHRRARTGDWQGPHDAGLARDFLGDASVLGAVRDRDYGSRR